MWKDKIIYVAHTALLLDRANFQLKETWGCYLEKNNQIHPECKKVYQTIGVPLQKVNIMVIQVETGVAVCLWMREGVCMCGAVLNKKTKHKNQMQHVNFDEFFFFWKKQNKNKKTAKKRSLVHLWKYEYGCLHMTLILWLCRACSYFWNISSWNVINKHKGSHHILSEILKYLLSNLEYLMSN